MCKSIKEVLPARLGPITELMKFPSGKVTSLAISSVFFA
jgi:hypothetical protein